MPRRTTPWRLPMPASPQTRESAKAAVSVAARDAAIAIVERLTGDKVSADDAAKAMGS